MKIKFGQWLCDLVKQKYENGRVALRLVDSEDGASVAMVTVNIPSEPLADDECFIKDWSENEGMVDALEEAGAVMRTGRVARTGFSEAIHCKLVEESGRGRY